jgi:hypothetical protein
MLTATLLSAFLLANQPGKPDSAPTAHVLDQKKIHSDYNDGNFETVVKDIEKFQKMNAEYSRADSLFIAKHLSVVYSADPATREKGKYYMYRLLEMLPSAKLIDMYVSDEIDRIFDKVKEEFVLRQKSFGVDSSQLAMPSRAPANAPDSQSNGVATTPPAQSPDKKSAEASGSKSDNKSLWIIAGVSAAAAGVAVAYLLASPSSNSGKGDKTYVVP